MFCSLLSSLSTITSNIPATPFTSIINNFIQSFHQKTTVFLTFIANKHQPSFTNTFTSQFSSASHLSIKLNNVYNRFRRIFLKKQAEKHKIKSPVRHSKPTTNICRAKHRQIDQHCLCTPTHRSINTKNIMFCVESVRNLSKTSDKHTNPVRACSRAAKGTKRRTHERTRMGSSSGTG